MVDISKETTLDELVRKYPSSIRVLMQYGIKGLACGQPVWGTLGSVAAENGYSEKEIDDLVHVLKRELT